MMLPEEPSVRHKKTGHRVYVASMSPVLGGRPIMWEARLVERAICEALASRRALWNSWGEGIVNLTAASSANAAAITKKTQGFAGLAVLLTAQNRGEDYCDVGYPGFRSGLRA
eukprot:CAMPEP_0183361050 /NCGR_PEP_ID=MMETSP0164_2-20130417/56219_1 /TAXON_ID=221442 /ORGANISM="Coccolithus pelagicus ssp braarudi, Strain PLY182g" /LENGTH=112 /DNA_ID=CAMNT_0025535503 /DNA_START=111 /DNA_END=449 /DNA_ORIENTATION=+